MCILGDPKGEKITASGVSQPKVRAEEAKAKSAQKLALYLMDIFFTKGHCPLYEVRAGIQCKCSSY